MVQGVEGGAVRVYTRAGDDGTTGLFLGGRVSKADALMSACGDIDEAVAVLGVARASCEDPEIATEVFDRQRDLFVVAADLAANPAHRDRLVPGVSLVTPDMVTGVERAIDGHVERHPLRPVFVVPGATPTSAHLDHARTVVRRAARGVVGLRETGTGVSDHCLRYLNRLSDLLFVLAREAAGEPEPPSHD
jgi:cob(I)alamin adenosyltransferase